MSSSGTSAVAVLNVELEVVSLTVGSSTTDSITIRQLVVDDGGASMKSDSLQSEIDDIGTTPECLLCLLGPVACFDLARGAMLDIVKAM